MELSGSDAITVAARLKKEILEKQQLLDRVNNIQEEQEAFAAMLDHKFCLTENLKNQVKQIQEVTMKQLGAAYLTYAEEESKAEGVAAIFTEDAQAKVTGLIATMFDPLIQENDTLQALAARQRNEELDKKAVEVRQFMDKMTLTEDRIKDLEEQLQKLAAENIQFELEKKQLAEQLAVEQEKVLKLEALLKQ